MLTKLPVLYHKGKKDKIYSWEISYNDPTFGYITTLYGTLDGKKVSTTELVEQKNIGKSNETSLEYQAEKEAKAAWNNKLARKYSETIEGTEEESTLPMLAKDYAKEKKKLKISETNPVDEQPKLDGYRATARWRDGKVVLISRQNKEYVNVPHINEAIERTLPKGYVLDGELYIHGIDFQTLGSWIKKARPESVQVEYHIYDIPVSNSNSDLIWADRRAQLLILSIFNNENSLKYVQAESVISEEQVIEVHDKYVTAGYEGAIIRTYQGKYIFGYRSEDLLKVKQFDDAEFTIVGYKSGKGSYENAVCWTCETNTGKQFDVNPKMSIAEKEELLKNADDYIGKVLTVRFFGLSNDGIPRFPVGIKFRLDEDLPCKK